MNWRSCWRRTPSKTNQPASSWAPARLNPSPSQRWWPSPPPSTAERAISIIIIIIITIIIIMVSSTQSMLRPAVARFSTGARVRRRICTASRRAAQEPVAIQAKKLVSHDIRECVVTWYIAMFSELTCPNLLLLLFLNNNNLLLLLFLNIFLYACILSLILLFMSFNISIGEKVYLFFYYMRINKTYPL